MSDETKEEKIFTAVVGSITDVSNEALNENSSGLTSYNPALGENELEHLKGDAIGDTLYSERFVLSTIIQLGKLDKDLREKEDVERDLCSLWDMTLEEDVVNYLLKYDILDQFAHTIGNTEDKRLIEILVGILGNMCTIEQTRNLLTENTELIQILLDLTSCMDSLMLEQLMRLITVVFIKMSEHQIEVWYTLIINSETFVVNLCFILESAISNSLILQTLEALNAILAKFFVLKLSMVTKSGKSLDEIGNVHFEELFVKPEVVQCTIEAFKNLVSENATKQDYYEAEEIPESIHKAKQTFCNIHSVLTQYQQLSRIAYESSNSAILQCFKDILRPIVEVNNLSNWRQYEQDSLETLNDVLRVLPQPFDVDILKYLLELFYKVSKEQEKESPKSGGSNDFESDDDDNQIDHQITYSLILNTLHYIIFKSDKKLLKQYMEKCPRKLYEQLLKSFKDPIEAEYLKNCYLKLQEILHE